MAKDLPGAPGAQHVAVIDAVRAQGHRRHQRHHLRPRVGRSPTVAQTDRVVDERLDPQALRKRRGEHDSRVGDRPLIIESHRDNIQSDPPVIMHHEGDLLRGPDCRLQS